MPLRLYIETMSARDKLINLLLSQPKNMRFSQAETLLKHYGYELIEGRGSRLKFKHEKLISTINMHKPQGSHSLKRYQIDQIIEKLTEAGLLS